MEHFIQLQFWQGKSLQIRNVGEEEPPAPWMKLNIYPGQQTRNFHFHTFSYIFIHFHTFSYIFIIHTLNN